MYIIRNVEIKNKIKDFGEFLKAATVKFIETLKCLREDLKEFIHYLEPDTRGECTLPFDLEDLERIVRCVFPDIVKYYEEKRSLKSEPEASAPLTDDAVLSDNKDAENLQPDKGGIKI